MTPRRLRDLPIWPYTTRAQRVLLYVMVPMRPALYVLFLGLIASVNLWDRWTGRE